jgi:hypothetical protein
MREALPLALSGIFDQGDLTRVVFQYGTGWEADDRQGDWGGMVVRPAALSLSCARDGSPKGGDALTAPFTTAQPVGRRHKPQRLTTCAPPANLCGLG